MMLVENKANVDPFAKRHAQYARVENQLAWLKRLMRVIIGVIVEKQRWLDAVVEEKRQEAATRRGSLTSSPTACCLSF